MFIYLSHSVCLNNACVFKPLPLRKNPSLLRLACEVVLRPWLYIQRRGPVYILMSYSKYTCASNAKHIFSWSVQIQCVGSFAHSHPGKICWASMYVKNAAGGWTLQPHTVTRHWALVSNLCLKIYLLLKDALYLRGPWPMKYSQWAQDVVIVYQSSFSLEYFSNSSYFSLY